MRRSSMPLYLPLLGFYCLLVVLTLLVLRLRGHKTLPLPPGPKGYPWLGSVFDIPVENPWLTYAEWTKKYGDIIHVKAFGRNMIIINSAKVANELLDKRSHNYSDRPRMVMARELMKWDWDFALMPYSDIWRRHRRVFHQYYQSRNLSPQYPFQRYIAINLLEQLFHSPESFSAHVRQYVGAAILRASFGYEVKSTDDFFVRLAERAVEPILLVIHAGAYLVDFLPFLKHLPAWFPGMEFKRKAMAWSKNTRDLHDAPFQFVKKSMAEGTAKECFVRDNLEIIGSEAGEDSLQEEILKNCAGVSYSAGSDTTVSLLLSFMLAMAHYPEVQARAQAEVDRVTGGSRLPDLSDRSSMSYVEALLSETTRWNPVTPMALPHSAINEDVYEGYRIPAGATITANAWAMLHDEKVYPDSLNFKPERFLNKEGHTVCPDPITMGAFGYGRRICPGRHFAANSAWIAIACILSMYHISKFVDEDGNVLEPKIEYTSSLISHPKPFNVRFTPRFPNTLHIIESAKLEAST